MCHRVKLKAWLGKNTIMPYSGGGDDMKKNKKKKTSWANMIAKTCNTIPMVSIHRSIKYSMN